MSNPRRLTIGPATRLCKAPIGRLLADPTFPPMLRGTFDEGAVLVWIANRDAKTTATTPTPSDKETTNGN
jgi:hypothetical protein